MLDSTNIIFHLLVSTNTLFSIHAGLISAIRLMDTNSNCLNFLNVGIVNIKTWSIFVLLQSQLLVALNKLLVSIQPQMQCFTVPV
jgi:hypothetical protein